MLRLIAAWFVLYSHSWALLGLGGKPTLSSLDQLLVSITPYSMKASGVAVAVFFVLSGYLITKSFVRSKNISSYVISRLVRIYPALWGCLILCAFGFGLYFTSLPTAEYLSSAKLWSFLKTNSLMLKVDFLLPPAGQLFPENPNPRGINGSLWTLPAEIRCYILVAIFGVLGAFKSKAHFAVAAGIILLYYWFFQDSNILYTAKQHGRLVLFFLIGSTFFVFREHIQISLIWTLVFWFLAFLARDTSAFNLLASVAIGHVCIVLAFHPKFQLPPIDRLGDYSYGLYLYAYPVQQSLIALQPELSPAQLVAEATVLAGGLAFLSWHVVEKRMIRAKRSIQHETSERIKQIESVW